MKLSFVVPGNPIPWKRARTQGKRRFNEPDVEAWKAAVFQAAARELGNVPSWPRNALYRVSADFYRKSATGTDLDRLLNAIFDGMEGVAYVKDRQVKSIGGVTLQVDKKNPRAVVTVEVL